jgi:hypothetical protein
MTPPPGCSSPPSGPQNPTVGGGAGYPRDVLISLAGRQFDVAAKEDAMFARVGCNNAGIEILTENPDFVSITNIFASKMRLILTKARR